MKPTFRNISSFRHSATQQASSWEKSATRNGTWYCLVVPKSRVPRELATSMGTIAARPWADAFAAYERGRLCCTAHCVNVPIKSGAIVGTVTKSSR